MALVLITSTYSEFSKCSKGFMVKTNTPAHGSALRYATRSCKTITACVPQKVSQVMERAS